MKISETIPTIKAQIMFKRTPCGRPITSYALECLESSLTDINNQENESKRCLNCCIIISGLLVPEGCPNCGSKDMTNLITSEDIL